MARLGCAGSLAGVGRTPTAAGKGQPPGHMLEEAETYVDAEQWADALAQPEVAFAECHGNSTMLDFIEGDAREERQGLTISSLR